MQWQPFLRPISQNENKVKTKLILKSANRLEPTLKIYKNMCQFGVAHEMSAE